MVCHPPPPPLAAAVTTATAFVSRHVAPIARPAVCLAVDVPPGSGQATPGTIWLALADGLLYAQPERTWPADRHLAVLHEVLHQIGMRQDLQVEQLDVEEGLVEAVSQDLRPVWLRRMIGRDRPVALAYRTAVVRVRRASAAAVGAPWTTAAARQWRVRMLAAPPATRAL